MTFDIKRAREICEAATSGPWEVWTSNSFRRITGPDGRDGGVLAATCRSAWNDGQPDLIGKNRDNDLAFIAESRALLPAALAEIDRLHREIDHAQAEENTMRDVLRAEHEECQRLRGALREACDLYDRLLDDGVACGATIDTIRSAIDGKGK